MCTLDHLPDEMLIIIFEKLNLTERIVASQVCTRWNNLILTHGKMLELIYTDTTVFYEENECPLSFAHFRLTLEGGIIDIRSTLYNMSNCSQRYSFGKIQEDASLSLASHLRALVMCRWLTDIDWPAPMISLMINLTTLMVHGCRLLKHNEKMLADLSVTCPKLQTVAFVDCTFMNGFNLSCLHCGFSRLQRFGFISNKVKPQLVTPDSFLDELLAKHPGLEYVAFEYKYGYSLDGTQVPTVPSNCNRILDILEERLQGRVISCIHLSFNSQFSAARWIRFCNSLCMKNARVEFERVFYSNYIVVCEMLNLSDHSL